MDESQVISFRERIRLNLVSAMKSANMSQVQLADKLGISKGTVNNWAKGNNSPDVDMVPQICRVLGISISALYTPLPFEPEEISEDEKKTAPEEGSRLSEAELRLVELYRDLNLEGQEKLLDLADDLVASGKYIKSGSSKLGKSQGA